MTILSRACAALALCALLGAGAPSALARAKPAPTRPHNVILFVADGLRSGVVTPQTAPALAAVRAQGVDFRNSHSLFPTVTTANASAIATGHYLGDTGNFSNELYVGSDPLPAPVNTRFAPIENDTSIAMLNARHGGNYLNEDSLLATARKAGFSTAVLGKYGPALVQDVTQAAGGRDAGQTLVIDDNTGRDPAAGSPPLPPEIAAAIAAAGLAPTPPPQVPAAPPGQPAHSLAGAQVKWMSGVAAKVVLPRFKAAKKPFILVFWNREPDATQHSQLDAPQSLTPGINGPSAMEAIRNASDALQTLRDAVKALGLEATTDIIVTADHGFATVDNESATSATLKIPYADSPAGKLPTNYIGIDLALALDLPLWTKDSKRVDIARGERPGPGSFLGADPAHPDIALGPGNGAMLIYLPGADPAGMARKVAAVLTAQDYAGGLFVNDDLGPVPGALPMSAVNLMGSAITTRPAMAFSAASRAGDCPMADTCEILTAESRPKGQGTHGSFGRGETHNFMAAIGPSFRKGFVDPSPVSNADLAWTIARITGLKLTPKGKLTGRPLTEALKGGAPVRGAAKVIASPPAASGFRTVLNYQEAGGAKYFDAAGMPGRVLGVKP